MESVGAVETDIEDRRVWRMKMCCGDPEQGKAKKKKKVGIG